MRKIIHDAKEFLEMCGIAVVVVWVVVSACLGSFEMVGWML